MKNGIMKIVIASTAFVFGACSDFLEKEPVSDLTSATFWKTEKDANVGLAAMYYSFSQAMSAGFYSWGEVRGGNWEPYERFGESQRELIDHAIPNTNAACNWSELYQAINRANLALKYIPDISMSPATKNQYLGEAYTMRALCYFYAVRVWGDVPMLLTPVEKFDKKEIYPSKTDRETVLEQIQSDLANAEQLLPTVTSLVQRTRFSKPAVYAIQMDVYAWLHRYDMVIKMMDEKVNLLAGGKTGWALDAGITSALNQADFITAYRKMFDKTSLTATDPMSSEQIFSVYYNQLENGTNQTIQYFITGGQRLIATDDLRNSYAGGDKRYLACFRVQSYAPEFQLHKYWITNIPGTQISDNFLTLYRYADLVLLYAEALNAEFRTTDAVTQLNRIRTRAGVSAATTGDFVDDRELADAILHERRVELIGEGRYWFDLIRTGNVARLGGCTNPADICFPVHRDHILQNPNLNK